MLRLLISILILVCTSGRQLMAQTETKNDAERRIESVFTYIETMPLFPGGDTAMIKWLSENVVYPEAAKKQGIQGRVYVHFIINKNGKPENIRIARSVHPLLDNEALRAVAQMPDWSPGMQDGKAVDVSFTIPLNFRSPKDTNRKKE